MFLSGEKKRKKTGSPVNKKARDEEPEPEPPEPTHFGRSRSRSRQKWGGSGSEKGHNCDKKGILTAKQPEKNLKNSLPMFVINNFRTSVINYLNFLDCQKHAFAMIWKSNKFLWSKVMPLT